MAYRIALLGLLAALLSAGNNRTDLPSKAAPSLAQEMEAPAAHHAKGDRLAKPVPVEVDGKPLERERGGLYPFAGDYYGDGRLALLLGPSGDCLVEDGRFLIYRNVGTKTSPQLVAPQWFDDTVPTGRIPSG